MVQGVVMKIYEHLKYQLTPHKIEVRKIYNFILKYFDLLLSIDKRTSAGKKKGKVYLCLKKAITCYP